MTAAGQQLVCSWSGGKDSCLALYRSIAAGGVAKSLLTMFIEQGTRSRNHGLAREVVQAQADSLNLALVAVAADWPQYEQRLTAALCRLQSAGIEAAVFGDIDIEAHRQWEENVCTAAGLEPHLPLWQSPRRLLLDELLSLGFVAQIVAVDSNKLDNHWLGRRLDKQLVEQLEQTGVDACGENGEFHTVVVDGPLFRYPLRLHPGETVLRSGYWFLDYRVD